MGIPKFFRYISERYPCISEYLRDYQIPEFDNLYLDMNGIVHACSHPNDSSVLFRISEENIFKNIFHYTEVLFHMIQPRELFFIAVDGVAPRAKINHQRSRRFRAARETEVQEAKARAKGIEIPKEKKFDSNCITPGTVFMSKLNKQLKYFVTYKISTDKLWQRCKIIFSGSEVPGEGEHKIMDYIRYLKVQPDYDPNTRHCLYGLDADLIMLGLCTHEKHFTLLREEVTFGKKRKKILTPEETKFCLLHLSLLREYINHEFSPIKDKLPFPYDIEKIIDDWVLMGFLVGNDFIPHLPNVHMAHGALPMLNNIYMDILPTLEGYINEAGTLRLDRFEKFMEELSHLDALQFSEHYADLKYFKSKTGRRPNESERHSYRKTTETCDSVASPKRVQDKDLDALIKSSAVMLLGQFHEDDASDDDSDSEIYQMEFVQHKRDYYMNKLEYENIDADFLRSQAEGYVRAIQWNLHYYYNGCCSWSWYYPHHYAPYISDIKDFKDLKLEFEMGEPFLPFQQLLAVLPPYSKDLLPAAFQPLLTEEQSPIIDYYPVEFKTDLNGKVQDWEAVVLIPFIDAEDLLDAMAPHFDKLTPEEQERNKHGPMYLYSYTKEDLGICKAPEYFPDINSHAELQLIEHKDIIVPREKLIKGRHPDARSDVYYPGFPTLQHIQHTASLSKIKPRVFDQPSRGECMMLRVTPSTEPDLMTVASELLGKSVFVNWPHLTEAQVVGASNCDTKISLINPQMNYCYENINEEEMKGSLVAQWNLQLKHITEAYKGCLGIDIGKTNILVHARPLIGSKYIFGSQGKLYLEKQWSELQSTYAYQVVVKDITVYCINAMLYKTVNDIFVPDSICFMLGHPHYGAAGKVLEPGVCERSGRIRVSVTVMPEPTLEEIKHAQAALKTNYMHGSIAAQHLGISSHLLSRITGTIYVKPTSDEPQQDDTKYNVGLNLKFNKKNEEIPGYTRNENGQWLYSTKAIDLIRSYMAKCPELFERLAENISKDIFQEETLFDKSTGELNDIVAWLKEKLQGMESRACGTEVLDACIVQKLEEKVDEYLKTQNNISKVISMQVKPHLLFKPGLHLRNLPPDPRAQSRLLDRICCTKDCFTAPLGSKGTIIGIQKTENRSDTMYDILFDKPFPGGLSLNGCSEFRAYRLSTNDFINITYGEEIENGKASITDAGAESVYTWRSSPNQKTQSRSSAFASFRKEGNRLKTDTPKSPQFRIKTSKKNSDETNQNEKLASDSDASKWQKQNSQSGSRQVHKASESVHQNAPSKNIEKNQPSVIPTSEFQALWNELHKKQKSNETSKTQLPAPRGAKIKQIDKDVAEDASQDPSAFLKAMLKISDVDAQRTAQSGVSKMFATNTVPQEQKISDAPPLVQRLFDYARQSEKVKEEKTPIWYCSQLLNYYQLSGLGMPRYTYFTDGKSSLVQTRILLPDARVFVGEPCPTHEQAAGSAAKKVYTELNLGKAPPDLRTLIPPPQQWCTSRQSSTWTQNVHPPMVPMYAPSNSQGPQHFPQWPTKVQQTPAFPPMMMHPNQFISPWTHSYNKPKYEIKNCMPFVPLQAQQKSRNITAKQGIQESNQCAKDNLQSVMQQRKTESTTKETKVQAVATANEKQAPAQSNVQQTQIKQNVKPKKSRVAAKFCTPSQTEENYNKNTT